MKKFYLLLFSLILISTSCVYAKTFDDTLGKDCETAVDRISYLGIVNGTTAKTYEPEKQVTRAELSKMIINVLAIAKNSSTKNFSDIDKHWAKEYILAAAESGILNGYTDGTFKPDGYVSYAEAVTIMLRSMGYKNLDINNNPWYAGYMAKMTEIELNNGVKEFMSNSPANRGDIAILLWNMIDKGSMIEKHFPSYKFFKNVKVNDITSYDGKIVYQTSAGNFYVEDNIDFSDLGGEISGFLDTKYNSFACKKTDEDKDEIKICDSIEALGKKGYYIYKCKNISGYGDKDHAEYAEIFVDSKTNQILRVVYYDTRESHFAEEVKIGNKNVTIESKHVYDQSIVQLKDGKLITYNILRNESVMDIRKTAVVVHEGKVVSWADVPNNCVIREIEKNSVYTYIQRYEDGALDRGGVGVKFLEINGKEYRASSECICYCKSNKQTTLLSESLTADDIIKIAKNNKIVRVYLNEFNEIVKLEFDLDVWKVNENIKVEETYKNLEKRLNRIGIVTNIIRGTKIEKDEEKDFVEYRVTSYSNSKRDCDEADSSLALGDIVYLPSGETKLKKISSSLSIAGINIIPNYNFRFSEDRVGNYAVTDSTKVLEFSLSRIPGETGRYSKCTCKEKTFSELDDVSKYKNIHLIVDDDSNILRMYAIKEVGTDMLAGVVKSIKNVYSGDTFIKTEVSVQDVNGKTNKYRTIPAMQYEVGDIITYAVKAINDNKSDKKNKDKEKGVMTIDEVYKRQSIGNEKDLIISKYSDGKIYFENSEFVLDTSKDSFEYDGIEYNFDDLVFMLVNVEKSKTTGEWSFKSCEFKNASSTIFKNKYRLVIGELTGIVTVYKGYRE